MCVIKTEDIYEDFSKDWQMFDYSIIQLSQNTMMIQTNELAKKKDITGNVTINKFGRLKIKMYSF